VDEENLGENFEDTPWCPPTLEKAELYKKHAIFQGGDAHLWTTDVCRSAELGIGVSLYFQLVRSIGVCFLVMTILSIPSLYFSWYGHRIPEEDFDSMGLYRYSLGNLGYNPNNQAYETDSACKRFHSYMASVNDTCIHLVGDTELPLSAAGTILTFFEMLQILVFFLTVGYLRWRTTSISSELSKSMTSVTDYSIMVQDIPTDTTADQLISHFNGLYPLDKMDWAKRPPLAGARPVQEVRYQIYDKIICHVIVAYVFEFI
jgi:hypothetical protein